MNAGNEKTDLTFKILTIGESGVGKTSVLLRYTEQKFNKNHLTTIGIDFKAKTINLHSKSIKLKIWDTAGQERFRNITQQYYKGADGIVLVFDVTVRESYEKVTEWMKQINLYTQRDKIGLVLLGNKVDAESREVKTEEGIALANEFQVKYFETSALNNLNIEESFNALTEEIMTKKNIEINKPSGNITLSPSVKIQEKKSGCC